MKDKMRKTIRYHVAMAWIKAILLGDLLMEKLQWVKFNTIQAWMYIVNALNSVVKV